MSRYPMTLFTTPGSLMGAGPGDAFLALQRDMNRLFDGLACGDMALPADQDGNQGEVMLAPRMDVSETDDAVQIEVELPGIAAEEIAVDVNDDVLTIRAEKRQDRRGVHVRERRFGMFQRSLRLPFQVDAEQVQARFENGVLRVTVPKAQQRERNRRVAVQGSQQQAGSEQDRAGQNG